MPLSSATRNRLSRLAARLLALREESMSTTAATALLIADGSLSASATIDTATPLSSALRNVAPANAMEIAEFLRTCETDGRGDDALGLIARTRPQTSASRSSLVIIGCEFAVLTIVVLIYALIVLPQLDATFRGYGVMLPAFTRGVFVVVTVLSPVMALLWLLFVVGALWRFAPIVFGPLIKSLDRIVLALPLIGPAIRGRNSVSMAGWLGFATVDEAAHRAAVGAARAWSRGLLSRICARALTTDAKGNIAAHLTESSGFDRHFIAAATMADAEQAHKAWRAQWRGVSDGADVAEPSWIGPLHIAFGIIVAVLVIAMYLPIFRIGILN